MSMNNNMSMNVNIDMDMDLDMKTLQEQEELMPHMKRYIYEILLSPQERKGRS
jgi:hypothetical protein